MIKKLKRLRNYINKVIIDDLMDDDNNYEYFDYIKSEVDDLIDELTKVNKILNGDNDNE